MKNIKRLFSVFAVYILCNGLSGNEPLTDKEFGYLLEELSYHRPQTLYHIAWSGHPQSLTVLQSLQDPPRTWGEFKEKHGYPTSAPDRARIIKLTADLEIALAAAGDAEQFQKIIDEFESGDSEKMKSALVKLAKVKTPEAIRFVVPLLDENDIFVDYFPLSAQVAGTLNQMLNIPETREYSRGHMSDERIKEWINTWKKWWKEHATEYGGTGDEVTLDVSDAVEEKSIPDPEVEEVVKAVEEKPKPEVSKQVVEQPAPAEKESEIIAEETEPKSNNLLPYILGAIVIVGVLFVIIRKKQSA